MEVNNNQFDEAVHHQLRLVRKMMELAEALEKSLNDMLSAIKDFKIDALICKQELLNSIKDDTPDF